MSFDYTGLNLIGYLCYSTFNCALYWSATVREQYAAAHAGAASAVRLNDVAFALHALVLTSVVAVQIRAYDRGTQAHASLKCTTSAGLRRPDQPESTRLACADLLARLQGRRGGRAVPWPHRDHPRRRWRPVNTRPSERSVVCEAHRHRGQVRAAGARYSNGTAPRAASSASSRRHLGVISASFRRHLGVISHRSR